MKKDFRDYIGATVILDDQQYSVGSLFSDRGIVELQSEKGGDAEISLERFRVLIANEKVLFDNNRHEHANRIYSPAQREKARCIRRLLNRDDQLLAQGLPWAMRHRKLTEEFANDPKFLAAGIGVPSIRSIQNYRKIRRDLGDAGLVPKDHLKGNRTARHDLLFEEIVLDLLEEFYLTSDRLSISEIVAVAGRRYRDACNEKRKTPKCCGYKAVKSITDNLPWLRVTKQRLGGDEARQRTVFAQDILKVEQPFDRVEIDCTTADIFVVDDEGNVVGRPTICAAIDSATGVILAMQLSLSAPSQSLVARTLKEMLVPKDDSFFDRHGISNRFQAYGRPLTIVTDQGSENGGDMIEAFVTAGSTEWQKNLPKHPWKKPFIERLFREISAFLQKLPGATCTAEIKRQDRTEKAMKEASLTLDDLETMLQVWRYDSYGMKPRRRVMNPLRSQESPTKCWRRLETTGFLDAPYTASEVRNMFMVRSEARTLFRYGINFKRLIYAGPELSSIIAKIGTGRKVEVCFDPHDIREIAVLDPDTGRHVPVRTKDPEMPAISFAELTEILEKTKPDPEEEIAARLVLAELAMAADKAGKSNKGLRSRRKAEIGRRKAREVNARSLHDKKVEMPLVDEAHAIPKPLKRPESYTRMVPR
ncbi:hypothetical protein AVO45_07800 [Ruegeria marisrubri]|uniref:Integrase catalytic domain-containing protein n=1 Tax=Ruegeria marisrubri TaxID=1685379 RepID=A0A0X3TWV1_9RHOB|nr:Mu transposase C-terminal domain-containing protein [Ruegeria marisrubri]KUJ77870.1 hypothetical protein AVO45_07800 [Ruegeria marisrubri]